VTAISAHRFASANPRALATTRRTGFTLARRLLGRFLFVTSNLSTLVTVGSASCEAGLLGIFGETSRCVLPTNATHYLTNCTRARGFLGSLRFRSCDSSRSQEDRCVSRRLRSLQRRSQFLRSRSVRSRSSSSLRFSCFVTRLCAPLRFFERWALLERRVETALLSFP